MTGKRHCGACEFGTASRHDQNGWFGRCHVSDEIETRLGVVGGKPRGDLPDGWPRKIDFETGVCPMFEQSNPPTAMFRRGIEAKG